MGALLQHLVNGTRLAKNYDIMEKVSYLTNWIFDRKTFLAIGA
jgi:hypothetical protein